MVEQLDARRYLQRIGDCGDLTPTLATLRRLHQNHLRTVPFETLDIHRNRPLSLEPPRLFEKIVEKRRGGFCYELNGLFALLLEDLGFHVTRLSGRVIDKEGSPGPEFDHLTLMVRIESRDWLADVGFGESFTEPIPMDGGSGKGERDVVESNVVESNVVVFCVVECGSHFELRHRPLEGDEKVLYTFTTIARHLRDFEEMCRFHQSSRSPFAKESVCSRLTSLGRITLRGQLLIETRGESRTETDLGSEAERDRALRERFGIRLVESDE